MAFDPIQFYSIQLDPFFTGLHLRRVAWFCAALEFDSTLAHRIPFPPIHHTTHALTLLFQ